MKPILFDRDETDFTTNGLGRLDCISCHVVEERNGMYELEAEVPISGEHASEIQQLSIIGAIPHDGGDVQAFVVYKITKPINGRFMVYARHISYRLSDIPCMPFSVSTSPQACANTLAGLKSNAVEECPFNFSTDVTTAASYSQKSPSSIRQRLGGIEGSVLDQFGGEYEWDNWDIHLWNKRGRLANVTGITLRYGKNITDINQEEEIANTATGVVPFWIDVDGNNLVVLPEKAVYSRNADRYPYHLTQVIDLSSKFQDKPTVEQLRATAQTYVNKSDFGVPKVSIKVSFINLWETEEYKNIAPLERVQLCDEINVNFELLGIDAIAKVVKTDYDVLNERYISIEVGSLRDTLAQAITDRDTEIDSVYLEAISKISKAVADATAWLTNANGYVVAVKNQDGSWKELLFMNTNDPTTATAGIRFNNNGMGFFSKALTPEGDIMSGPYSMAWTMDGRLGDFANKNFWNFLTGEFSLSAGTTVGGKTVQRIADDAQAAAEATAAAALAATAADLQSQIDGQIMTWFYNYAPTTLNAPASTWTTIDDKINHIGDLFYDGTTGYSYRWQIKTTAVDPEHPTANDFEWVQISDEDISAALALAQTAKDTADNKRRIFITQPVPPYDTGDLWCVGSSGDILTCTTAKTTGQTYAATDWSKLNKYVDSTDISNAISSYDQNQLNQQRVWAKLTGSSNDCIILENGVLGLKATAMQVGKLADKYNYNFWNLDTGEMKIAANARVYDDDADYSGAYIPTNSNSPASSWNTEELKKAHIGTTFLNTSINETYVYGLVYPETSHPYESNEDAYYKFITGLNSSVKLHFNSKSETESVTYDYIDLFYLDNGTYYKRRLGGTIGGIDVVIPSDTFWLHWHTDSSVTRWGWRIDSIIETIETATGFSSDTLPSATWTEITNPYEWYLASMSDYIVKDLSQEQVYNILTNNGQEQGIFLQNGKLYLNGQYFTANKITIGGSNYQNKPTLEIKNSSDQVIGSWTQSGIRANAGIFGGLAISTREQGGDTYSYLNYGGNSYYIEKEWEQDSETGTQLTNGNNQGSLTIVPYLEGWEASDEMYCYFQMNLVNPTSAQESATQCTIKVTQYGPNGKMSNRTSGDIQIQGSKTFYLNYDGNQKSSSAGSVTDKYGMEGYQFNKDWGKNAGEYYQLDWKVTARSYTYTDYVQFELGDNGEGWSFFLGSDISDNNPDNVRCIGKFQGYFTGNGSFTSLDLGNWTYSPYDDTWFAKTDKSTRYAKLSPTEIVLSNSDDYSSSSSLVIQRAGIWRYGDSVMWDDGSDERIKHNIKPLSPELSKQLIDGTQPKSFEFNAEEKQGKHYGMIAQEARALLDSLGEEDAQLEYSSDNPGAEVPDKRSISYQEYIPHLINYVKRQQAEIDELKEIVKKLSV